MKKIIGYYKPHGPWPFTVHWQVNNKKEVLIMFYENNGEFTVLLDPATTDPQLIATCYKIMKEYCGEVEVKRIPKQKNKSSYQYQ